MMDFSGGAGAASGFDLLPDNLLVFCNLNVSALKATASGGAYIDCELTVDANQPFAGRKFFEKIGDPMNPGNSEKYREMGMIAVTRILEAGRGAGPANPAGYQIATYDQLSGLRVAVKVGIEPGTQGHADKNRVKEWLTPNPASQSGNKGWVKLVGGDHGVTQPAAAQPAQTGFGGFGSGASVAQPAAPVAGFGGQPAASGFGGGQPANPGFPQPAGNAVQSVGAPANSTGFAQTPPATTPSPSDPGATPQWLAQAGSQAAV